MRTLKVRRKGYTRKTASGRVVRVRPAVYSVKDRGARGRGPKVVPPLREGALGGPGFFRKSRAAQERTVFARAKKLGERTVVGELRALQVFFKRTKPAPAARALDLTRRAARSFKGTRRVTYPEGFTRAPRRKPAASRKPTARRASRGDAAWLTSTHETPRALAEPARTPSESGLGRVLHEQDRVALLVQDHLVHDAAGEQQAEPARSQPGLGAAREVRGRVVGRGGDRGVR